MKIPFLDLKSQYITIKNEIQAAINQVLETTSFALGPAVEEFEEKFADYCQAKYAVGVNSGTSALHLSLAALGIGPGDEVITTPHTFISTIWAISYMGARPIFVDIDPKTYTIDPAKIIEKVTDRTKAILPVHLYGQSANLAPILEIAKAAGLVVVEDSAQAHGAEFNGKRCGSIGDAGCFSFYPGKNLGAYGEAGAVVTNSPEVAARVKILRNHSQEKKFYHSELGYNYRMDGIQGAVLNVKLKYLEEWTAARRKIASKYTEAFSKAASLVPAQEAGYSRHVYHLYELGLPSKELRDGLREYLNGCQIQTGLHYPVPVHLQQAYKYLGYKRNDFPETEKASDCLISLPIYPEMSGEMVDFVIEKVLKFV